MPPEIPEVIVNAIGQLGVSSVLGIFLWLFWQKINSKDTYIETQHAQLVDAYKENTRVIENQNNLMAIIVTSTKELGEKSDEILRRVEDVIRLHEIK